MDIILRIFSVGPSAMSPELTQLERAFQLARSGICASVCDIRKHLRLEGYSASHIEGRTLVAQLRILEDTHGDPEIRASAARVRGQL